MICVYDEARNVTETHKHAGEFKEWSHSVRNAVTYALKEFFRLAVAGTYY